MMAAPRPSPIVPGVHDFIEENDEEGSIFSDNEMRSGDEGDGGEFILGGAPKQSTSQKIQALRRSKRKKSKRQSTDSAGEPLDVPASNVQSQHQMGQLGAPGGRTEEKSSMGDTYQLTDTEPKQKTVAKRKNIKLENHFQKKKKEPMDTNKETEQLNGKETPEALKNQTTGQENSRLKLVIRLPRSDNSKPTRSVQPSANANGPPSQRNNRRRSKKKAKHKKRQKGPTVWHHSSAVTMRHSGMTGEPTRVKNPTTTGPPQHFLGPSMPPHHLSVPQPMSEVPSEVQHGVRHNNHFVDWRQQLRVDERNQEERYRPGPTPNYLDQPFLDPRYGYKQPLPPVLTDILSSPTSPHVSSLMSPATQSQGSASFTSFRSTFTEPNVQVEPSRNPALEMQRQRWKELREQREQLQQQRQEKQHYLQHLQQYIQAQRQLHHQQQPSIAPTETTASFASISHCPGERYPDMIGRPVHPPATSSLSANGFLPTFGSHTHYNTPITHSLASLQYLAHPPQLPHSGPLYVGQPIPTSAQGLTEGRGTLLPPSPSHPATFLINS